MFSPTWKLAVGRPLAASNAVARALACMPALAASRFCIITLCAPRVFVNKFSAPPTHGVPVARPSDGLATPAAFRSETRCTMACRPASSPRTLRANSSCTAGFATSDGVGRIACGVPYSFAHIATEQVRERVAGECRAGGGQALGTERNQARERAAAVLQVAALIVGVRGVEQLAPYVGLPRTVHEPVAGARNLRAIGEVEP